MLAIMAVFKHMDRSVRCAACCIPRYYGASNCLYEKPYHCHEGAFASCVRPGSVTTVALQVHGHENLAKMACGAHTKASIR